MYEWIEREGTGGGGYVCDENIEKAHTQGLAVKTGIHERSLMAR
jgi:hypothetical protein